MQAVLKERKEMSNKIDTHEETRKILDALFVGDPVDSILDVREHLKTCRECQNYFDELADADRWVPQDVEVEESFTSRYSLAVMRAVDFQAARLSPAAPEPSLLGRLKQWWSGVGKRTGRLVPIGAMLLAGLVGVGVWSQLEPVESAASDDFWQPRGHGVPTNQHHRVDLFCVEVSEGNVQFHESNSETRELDCGVDEELKFALINASTVNNAWSYPTLVGVSETGRTHWYKPLSSEKAETASMKIAPSERLRPLGETLRLSVNHSAGMVHLTAIFSNHPLPKNALSERIREGRGLDGFEIEGSEGKVILGAGSEGRYAVVTQRLMVQGKEHRAKP